MARAGAATNLTTTSTAVFQCDRFIGKTTDGEPAMGIRVTCPTGAAQTLLVNIPQLHKTDWVTVTAGSTKTFLGTRATGPLSTLNLKSSTSTTSYEFEIFA